MIHTSTLTTADEDRWRAVLPIDVSVSGSLEYVRICEQETGWPGRLFVVEDGGPVAAYPYLLRPARTLPFVSGLAAQWSDTCSTEYRGPLWLNGGPLQGAEVPTFSELFASHCRDQHIVAEFAHLSPWVSEDLLELDCAQPNREIVYVDLTQTADEIWTRSLSSDARRQTKQGQRAGVRVRRAVSTDDVREFYRLYTLTMERREALERYFFSLEYFLAFFETMSANAFFVLAEYEGRAVAGGLFFQDKTELHWHLSAADREYGPVRPVNVYLYETIRQALGQGRVRMIMGGSYGNDDGVFRFKANFSPLRAQFRTYRRVHDAAAYATLTEAWSAHHGGAQPRDEFFPTYRATPTVEVPVSGPNILAA
jgi:serine/alanine adding enzyme